MKDSEILTEQGLRDIYYDPSEGYQFAERLYQKAKEKGLSVSRRMVREWLRTQYTRLRHVHEVQTHRQKTQVPKNFRKEPRGPGTTGLGGHGKIRKQEQGLPLDINGCRNPEPVRLYDTRLQEGHQEHGEVCRPSVGVI